MIDYKNLILCRSDGTPITTLNSVCYDTINYEEQLKDYNTLSFEADRYIAVDGKQLEANGYHDLKAYMTLYLEDIGFFQLQEPTQSNDGTREYKEINAYSCDKELEGCPVVGIKINKGTSDSLEYLADNNINDIGFAKEYVTVLNTNPQLSLMHYVMGLLPGWSIGYIDPLIAPKKLSVDEDSTNVYALLNSIVAPKLDCIFTFDIKERKINAYHKSSIGKDTNIFITYRSLLNSVGVDCDEDSIFTKFYVQGDNDLDIRNVNFGEKTIIDLSYFMCQPYMNQSLVEKLKYWKQYREEKRPQYVSKTREYLKLMTEIDDITLRVPNDGCDWKQWDSMTEELLNKNMKYFSSLLTSMQVGVDDNPQYDAEKNYIPWKKDGKIDHDRYLQKLKEADGGYYTYFEILNYILPNIQVAIDNLGVVEGKEHDYVKEYETNWELYGIKELEAKRDLYGKEIKESLISYEKPWNNLTPEEQIASSCQEAYYTKQHDLYTKYMGYLGSETTKGSLLYKLKELHNQKNKLTSEQETISAQRIAMQQDVSMDNVQFNFSKKERLIIDTLLLHSTDYTNSNILTTSVDTTLTTLEVQESLYQDAVEKISEMSQPQYTFSSSIDNLLSLPEFQCWKGDFCLGNFIRLGIRDDYSVKLRIIGCSYNPCIPDSKLSIDFSNMISSRSGRNDFTHILENENMRGGSSGISIGNGSSKDEKEYLTSLLQLMTQSKLFKEAVSDTHQWTDASITSLISNYIKVAALNVDKLVGTEAQFDKFFSTYIDADYISSRIVIGDFGDFKELVADLAKFKLMVAGGIIADSGQFMNLTADNVHMDDAVIKDIIAKRIRVADLKAGTIDTDQMTISSKDGGLKIAGNTMQFSDSNEVTRIQIGQDGNGNFTFVLYDETGKGVLLDSTGVKESAICDGLIKNDMLAGEISKDKLGFDTIETDKNGNITAGKVMIDGQGMDVAFTTIKEEINGLSTIAQSIALHGQQVFTENNGELSPSSITITAETKQEVIIGKWFLDGVENTSFISSDKKTITIPSSYMRDRKTAVVKVQNPDRSVYDVFTIYKVSDGSDAITSVLTSSNGWGFNPDKSAIANTTLTCQVYKGVNKVEPQYYKWMGMSDTGQWTPLGTTKTITINLNVFQVQLRVYCEFDL